MITFASKNNVFIIYERIQTWSGPYQLHRLNGPAVVWSCGDQEWIEEGIFVKALKARET